MPLAVLAAESRGPCTHLGTDDSVLDGRVSTEIAGRDLHASTECVALSGGRTVAESRAASTASLAAVNATASVSDETAAVTLGTAAGHSTAPIRGPNPRHLKPQPSLFHSILLHRR